MSNIVIIGSGPAGVSAALYTARAGVDTTVLTRGPVRLTARSLSRTTTASLPPSRVRNWSVRASRGPRLWASNL